MNEVFRELSWDVLSPKKEVFVDEKSWLRVTQLREVSEEKSHNIVYFLSMLRPDQFSNAILLGANIEDSLLYHWFGEKGAKFKREEEIAENLRPQSSALGRRLTIHYFAEDQTFSKTLAKKEAIGGGTIIDAMDRLAVETFAGEPFLYVPNKDRKSEIVNAAPGVKTLSTVSHGLNAFQDYTNIYVSAALNREPKHYLMLEDLGLDSETVHKSTYCEAVYQAVMRTSLRDPEASEPVRVILPDLCCARYLFVKIGCLGAGQLGPAQDGARWPISTRLRHVIGRS